VQLDRTDGRILAALQRDGRTSLVDLAEQVGLKRLFLHAASMEFALDGGATPYLVTAPLSDGLRAVLDRLA
jgi:hypothetical protein